MSVSSSARAVGASPSGTEHDPGGADPLARPLMAAGALVTADDGSVLLVRPTYKPGWEIPGGMVEPGESPATACAREVREELGLDRPVGRLLVVDWAPHPTEGDKVLWIFDGGTMPRALPGVRPDVGEIAEVAWVRPDDLGPRTPDRLTRRVLLAVRALRTGRTLYAEHGHDLARKDPGRHRADTRGLS